MKTAIIYQVPGDTLNLSETSFAGPLTLSISSQSIAGYVPLDQLNDDAFSSPVEVVLQPGEDLNVTNPRPLSTPEPTVVSGLLAISFGTFLKRKLLKNNTKA